MSGHSNILLSYGEAAAGNGLLTNLLAYYKLDETSGTFVDAHSTLDSVAESVTAYNQTGKINGAPQFVRALSNYIRFSSVTGIGSGDRSVSLWANISALPVGGVSSFFTFSETDGTNDFTALNMRVNDSGLIAATVSRFPNNAVISSSAVATSTWHHIVASVDYSASTVYLYVNNSYIGSATWTGAVSANQQYTIGRYNANYGHHLSGYVDEVAIYKDYLLDATDVSNLYNGGAALAYSSFTS